VPVVNTTAGEIPAGAVVWIQGWRAADYAWNAKQIQYEGVTRIGIAGHAIPASAEGWVWTGGIRAVLCEAYAAIEWHNRVRALANSWYAKTSPNDAGQMLAVGTVAAADQPAGLPGGVGLLLVRLDCRRPSV